MCLGVQAIYHADFERSKGKYTTVADDPETMRIKEASKVIRYTSVLKFTLML
jgi:hypothetical protein